MGISLADLVQVGAVAGGAWALNQWRTEQRWKRFKFTREILSDKDSDPVIIFGYFEF